MTNEDLVIGVLFIAAVLVQYAVVFGASYTLYRAQKSDLSIWRSDSRFFGCLSSVFVFLAVLIQQIIEGDSWAVAFLVSAWVIGAFVAHDLALGLAIKKSEASKK